MKTPDPETPRQFGKLTIRVPRGKPAHHLWNNNGTWWTNFCVRQPDGTRKRIRESLQTNDFETACKKRDKLFRALIRADSEGGIPL